MEMCICGVLLLHVKSAVCVYVSSVNRIAEVSVELLNEIHEGLRSGSCVVQRLKDLIYLDGEPF